MKRLSSFGARLAIMLMSLLAAALVSTAPMRMVHAHTGATLRMNPMRICATATAKPPPLSGLKKLAISQADTAANIIVETNQLLDPAIRDCVDCKPSAAALANQQKALLPASARALIARVRLWGAYRLMDLEKRIKDVNVPLPKVENEGLQRALTKARPLLVSVGCVYMAIFVAFLIAAIVPPTIPATTRRLTNNFCLRLPLLLLKVEVAWG